MNSIDFRAYLIIRARDALDDCEIGSGHGNSEASPGTPAGGIARAPFDALTHSSNHAVAA
jgi:hypothetical protein